MATTLSRIALRSEWLRVAQALSDEASFEAQRLCLAGSSKLGSPKGIYSHDDARRGTLDLFESGLQVRSGSDGKCRQQGRQEFNLLVWLRYEETLFRAYIRSDPRAGSCERHPGADFLADRMIRFA
jgi:hypothetical protein